MKSRIPSHDELELTIKKELFLLQELNSKLQIQDMKIINSGEKFLTLFKIGNYFAIKYLYYRDCAWIFSVYEWCKENFSSDFGFGYVILDISSAKKKMLARQPTDTFIVCFNKEEDMFKFYIKFGELVEGK